MRSPSIVLALAALAAALAPAPFGSSIPTPGANDAGSGTDAGDVPLLAMPVAAGTHAGAVQAIVDAADHYAIAVPGVSVARVRVTASAPVAVSIVDEDALVRAQGAGANVALGAIAVEGASWTIAIASAGAPVALAPTAYTLRVSFEAREHAERVELPAATAHAMTLPLPAGRFVRAEIVFVTTESPLVPAPFATIGAAALCSGPGVGVGAEEIHLASGLARASLLAHGDEPLPAEVTVTGPAMPEGERVAVAAIESGTAAARWSVGLAAGAPMTASAFLAWNGARPDAQFPAGSISTMLPASSFDGDGTSLTVAGWSLVEDGVAALEVPARSTSVVIVDASNGAGATQPTRMRLVEPSGRVRDLQAQPVVLWSEDVAAGAYGAQIVHLDGVDGGRYRLMGASFPFPARCAA